MLDLPRIFAGFLLSTLIGWVAYRRGSLSRSGWLGAILTGGPTFGFGGWTWGLTLIVFFITSSVLSHLRQAQKQRIAGEKFEKGGRRDIWQAFANGGIGTILAIVFGLSGEPMAVLALFAGVMATVTADTWGTEIGVLARQAPRLITTLRPTTPGTSGGITLAGTLAGAVGGLVIGISLWLLQWAEHGQVLLWFLPACTLAGVLGSLSDSWLGATVQAIYRHPQGHETEKPYAPDGTPNQQIRGFAWMNNDLVNILSSLFGGLVAWIIWLGLANL